MTDYRTKYTTGIKDLPEVDIPPELAERMARAIDRRIKASIIALLWQGPPPSPPPPRWYGVIRNPVS